MHFGVQAQVITDKQRNINPSKSNKVTTVKRNNAEKSFNTAIKDNGKDGGLSLLKSNHNVH